MDYVPGWWDTIGPSALKAFDSLQHAVAPDYYAQKAFEDAARKNPELITQLSNMDPQSRQLAAQSYGAKKNVGMFDKIPEGAQLKKQKMMSGWLDQIASDPNSVDAQNLKSTFLGIESPRTMQRQDKQDAQGAERHAADMQKLPFEIKNLSQDADMKQIALEREKNLRDAIVQARVDNPTLDVNSVIRAATGQTKWTPQIQQQNLLISQLPGLDKAVKDAIEVYKIDQSFNRQVYASDHAHQQNMNQEKFRMFSIASSDAHKDIAESNAITAGIDRTYPFGMVKPPEVQAQYDLAIAKRNAAQERLNTFIRPVMDKQFGIKEPEATKPPPQNDAFAKLMSKYQLTPP